MLAQQPECNPPTIPVEYGNDCGYPPPAALCFLPHLQKNANAEDFVVGANYHRYVPAQ
jgi:hypothetical protein